MFFEDEKDFIGGGADIQIDDDGTVTWEDVLSNADDEIVSVKQTPSAKKVEKTVELSDELELVVDEDEVDEQELAQILNNSANQPKQPQPQPTQQYTSSTATTEEDFDIDSQLANVVLEGNDGQYDDEVGLNPRKNERKQSSGLPALLIALVFAMAVGGGIYYFLFFKGSSNEDIPALAPVQQVAQNPQLNPQEQALSPEEIKAKAEERRLEREKRRQEKEAQLAQEQAQAQAQTQEANAQAQTEQKQEEKKEDKTAEKKQVINVTPTGRENPFMPIKKYMTMEIDETVLDFGKVNIPKPPNEFGEKNEIYTRLLTIAVSGIMYDEQKPSAIITYDNNDYFVQEGDKLDEYRVIDISRTSVVLGYGKNTYRASIGEEFKVSEEFEGSAKYMTRTEGGGRQYTTAKEEDSRSEQSKTRYVSESDITINAR